MRLNEYDKKDQNMLYYVLKICNLYMQTDEHKIWAELHDKCYLPHRKAGLIKL